MNTSEKTDNPVSFPEASVADLPDTCVKKIRDCERELNKQGFWNIALVSYQLKDH